MTNNDSQGKYSQFSSKIKLKRKKKKSSSLSTQNIHTQNPNVKYTLSCRFCFKIPTTNRLQLSHVL